MKALQRLAASAPELIEHEDRSLSGELVGELRRLSGEDRDALLLVVWGELSYDEAAIAVGVPIGTVKSRIARARRALGRPSIRSSADSLPSCAKQSFSMPERGIIMELLYAIRDLGVADPATDSTGEETVRAALAREIDKATGRPAARRARRTRPRLVAGASAAVAAR